MTTYARLLLIDPPHAERIQQDLGDRFDPDDLDVCPWTPGTALPDWPSGARVLCYLSDAALAELLPELIRREWRVGLLPHPDMPNARLGFGIASELAPALDDALSDEEARAVDVLYCNERPVFQSILIGDVFSLRPGQGLEAWRTRLRLLWRRLRLLGSLIPTGFRLESAKGKLVETAGLGIAIVEHARNSAVSRRLLPDTAVNDGMLHALILAPRSIIEMLGFLIRSALGMGRDGRLPEFVGHLKTSRLKVSASTELRYLHDGEKRSARDISLEVAPGVLQIFPGRHLEIDAAAPAAKESVRTQHLPAGESRRELVQAPLPLINHASTEDFRDLYVALRDSATASPSYMTLMVLSTLLAVFGLFANSTPVIIGAMILAPMMAPIIASSMGAVRQDDRLLGDSLQTLAIGIGLSLSFAALASWIIPFRAVTAEIEARLTPTLLDLGVAVVSGIAGAYAHAREEVAKSLAGVAIAVALVPPLAVAGIGLGWADWSVFSGAFLMFLTNLGGMILAGGLTFLMLGFAPFHLAHRGLAITLVAVVVLSIPLSLSFSRMATEQDALRQLEGWVVSDIELRDVKVRSGRTMRITATLLAEHVPDDAQLDQLRSAIETRMRRPVELILTTAIVR